MTTSGHRRTVVASGLLCCALILVVLFTSPAAFRSPAAVVVMALIGTAAVLVQLRLRNDDQPHSVRPPLWLNTIEPRITSLADYTPHDRIAVPGIKTSFAAVVLQMAVAKQFGIKHYPPNNACQLQPEGPRGTGRFQCLFFFRRWFL